MGEVSILSSFSFMWTVYPTFSFAVKSQRITVFVIRTFSLRSGRILRAKRSFHLEPEERFRSPHLDVLLWP